MTILYIENVYFFRETYLLSRIRRDLHKYYLDTNNPYDMALKKSVKNT